MVSSELQMMKSQRGATLIVGMIMLLLMAIIGVSAIQTTTLQERMSGNMRDSTMAFQAAEVAIRYVEEDYLSTFIELDVGANYANCSSGCQIINSYEQSSAPLADLLANSTSWASKSVAYGSFKGTDGTTAIPAPTDSELIKDMYAKPRLIVEYAAYKPDAFDTGSGAVDDTGLHLYRNTVQAYGATSTSEAIVQTVFARRYK